MDARATTTTTKVERGVYAYNPNCHCTICRDHNGTIPDVHPHRGHSFCYDEPHIPPARGGGR